MTVSTTDNEVVYVSGGPAFPIPYRFLQNSDIEAVIVHDDGTIETLTGAQYTLTGAGTQSGGTLTSSYAASVLAGGDAELTISRVMIPVQPTDLRNQGKYLAETHETVFDRLTMLVQQCLSGLSRALLRPLGKDYYDAMGRRIANLGDPVDAQDAATKSSVDQAIADALSTGQGPGNNAANVLYVTPGAKLTTVQAKLRETVSLSDFNSLREALAYGELVHVPASTGSITVSAADSPFVLPNLWRVDAEGDLTINLGAGAHTTTAGVICRIGARNSNIKLLGPVPAETKATAVTAVTGVAGDWQVTYTLQNASGAQVGDFAKLFDVGPLPILMGDNAASYILRDYPLMGELYRPLPQNVGAITYSNGGGSVSFASVNGALNQYMHDGDLLHSKGQTRRLNVVGGTSASIFGAWSNGGVTGSSTFFISRPNAGTIGTGGVASQTITGTGTAFTTEGNVGSILLVQGTMLKITSIANDGSLGVDAPITLADGTYYSILHPQAALHAGVHEIVNVSGNSVTVRNRGQAQPPINGVTVDEFKIIKAVLKQTGTAAADDGFVCDQNGSLREINNLVIVGPGAGEGYGLLLQNRIPSELAQGTTSFGDVTQHGMRGTLLLGENVGVTRFFRGVMVGHGCLLNGRKLAVTNPLSHGIYTLEGGISNLRRTIISGGNIGHLVNAGAVAVITEQITVGTAGDGTRADANATLYGECPIAVGAGGMNFRFIDSGGCHLTDGVSFLSALSGVYCDGGDVKMDRMTIGANGRVGVELFDGASFHCDSGWVSGTSNTAGSGYGLQMGNDCTFIGSGVALVGNEVADIAIPSGTSNANVVLRSSYQLLPTLGVTRNNSPTANGSAVWDGAGADSGTSTPTIGAASGAIGASTGSALAWTRDKDRYEFDARVTITTVGTAAGYLTMSLPFTVTALTPVAAINQTTGAVCGGYALGTTLTIYSAAGAFPAANGNTIVASGAVRA